MVVMENIFSLTVTGYIMLIAGALCLICTIIWIISDKSPENKKHVKYDASTLRDSPQIYVNTGVFNSEFNDPIVGLAHNTQTESEYEQKKTYTGFNNKTHVINDYGTNNRTQVIDNSIEDNRTQIIDGNGNNNATGSSKFCTSCGAPLQPNAKYCPMCGKLCC